jgi:sulfur carrier protein
MSEYKKRDAEQKGAKKHRQAEEKRLMEDLTDLKTVVTVVLPNGIKRSLNIKRMRRYEELLIDLCLNPETVIVLRNGTPVPLDDVVETGELKILKVVSGG